MKVIILASWESNIICKMNDTNARITFLITFPEGYNSLPSHGEAEIIGVRNLRIGETTYHPLSITPITSILDVNEKEYYVMILINKICQDKNTIQEKGREVMQLKKEIALLRS